MFTLKTTRDTLLLNIFSFPPQFVNQLLAIIYWFRWTPTPALLLSMVKRRPEQFLVSALSAYPFPLCSGLVCNATAGFFKRILFFLPLKNPTANTDAMATN